MALAAASGFSARVFLPAAGSNLWTGRQPDYCQGIGGLNIARIGQTLDLRLPGIAFHAAHTGAGLPAAYVFARF